MLALVFLAFAAQGGDVTGLRAGESVAELEAPSLDRNDPARERESIRPRVLDAVTGAPIEGVLVETWTEDGVAPLHVQTQIDCAVTGRDGCARVCMADGISRAEKVRLSKAGYSSREVPTSDAYQDEVRLYAAQPFEGRVLDLEGRPVAGAIVRTRESCAHAIPASQARTDAFGRFRMEDFPPLSSGLPQVEIVDMRHAPLFELEAIELRRQASFYGALDFYVARRPALEFQLVDGSGSPIANRRVMRNEAPSSTAWTDENGLCVLPPSRYDSSETCELADPNGKVGLHSVLFVDGRISRTGPAFVDSDDASPQGRLTVRLAGTDGGLPPPIVILPEGRRFFDATDGQEARVPLGRARIVVGGDFSGFVQASREVDVTKRPQQASIALQREPRVRIHMQDRAFLRLVIQAGDRSASSAEGKDLHDDIWETGVPASQPITILWELDDGGLRRASIAPLEPGTTTDVDLEAESSILRHGMSEAPVHASELRFVVTGDDGRPLAASLELITGPDADIIEGTGGSYRRSLPAHTPFRATFSAEGYTPAYIYGVAPSKPDAEPRRIVMTRRSRLELRGDVSAVELCGGEAELGPAGYDLDTAAGPLTLVVERSAGPPLALDLMLSPGETRRIEVH